MQRRRSSGSRDGEPWPASILTQTGTRRPTPPQHPAGRGQQRRLLSFQSPEHTSLKADMSESTKGLRGGKLQLEMLLGAFLSGLCGAWVTEHEFKNECSRGPPAPFTAPVTLQTSPSHRGGRASGHTATAERTTASEKASVLSRAVFITRMTLPLSKLRS